MFELLGLDIRCVNFSSAPGAGDKDANCKPTDGETWIVAEALGYNDEGALNGRWTFSDGSTTITIDPAVSHDTTDRVSVYAKSPLSANAHSGWKLPIRLTSKSSLKWTTFGLGAGKKSYIDACVYVLRGVPEQ